MLLALALALADPVEQVLAERYTPVSDAELAPVLPYGPELLTALGKRDHAAALPLLQAVDRAKLSGAQQAEHAFVMAWTLQRAGRGKEALPLLEAAGRATVAPRAYVDLVVGEILLADGQRVQALEPLQRVLGTGPIEARARLALARAYDELERTADARAVYDQLLARPDPAPGSATAAWAVARRVGPDSPAGQALVRRLYRHYPGSAEDRASADVRPALTLEDLAWRGDALQERGSWDSAADLLDDRLAEVGAKTAADCVYRYAYGRAQHKRGNLTIAVEALSPMVAGCATVDPDRAARAAYLIGKSLERKKDWAGAARWYAQIPERFPTHSMADDGYALGGIALQEAGDLAGARRLWAQGFEAHPHGDLAAETAWRLAWGAHLAGDTGEALAWTERSRAEVPLASAPTDAIAAWYWNARWTAWPDPQAPAVRASDPEAVARAQRGFEEVIRRWPWHYYAVLSAARLEQLRPGSIGAHPRPAMDRFDAPWLLPADFLLRAEVRHAMGLARLGLYGDALVEVDALDEDRLDGAEMAIITGWQAAAGDFLVAHDRLRRWLATHPPETLGPNAWKVMRQAYPDRWWPEVKAAAPYAWDPRLFHALVREESNFNPEIKSHAGACGLAQLMPGTFRGVATKMGLTVASSDIWKPEVNLKIGAWYLDTLHSRYRGNSGLALAGYNAGEGNVDKWLELRPDWPTDAFVEAIPFRETRHYVKRVMSTWQTYRVLEGSGPLFADFSALMDDAVPSAVPAGG